MSKWRLRGYVPDSDEEEEGIDGLSTNASTPSQHKNDARVANRDGATASPKQSTQTTEDRHHTPNTSTLLEEEDVENCDQGALPALTQKTTQPNHQQERTESPDPIQCSPAPHINCNTDSTLSFPAEVHQAANVHLPSNDPESDDVLSDPPSEEDDPHELPAPAQRRQTVQVVIQQSPILPPQQNVVRPARFFRARKPIQLNPYLLEQERYRQECLRRGIKPVARPRSSRRHSSHDDAETQEQDFDPGEASPSNSPPNITSTAPISRKRRDERSVGSLGRPRSSHGGQSGYNTTFSRTQPEAHYAAGRKRRKLNPPPIQARRHAAQDPGRRMIAGNLGDNSKNTDIWNIPHSPPASSSPFAKGITPPLQEFRRPATIDTLGALPTPSNSSSILGAPLAEESGSDIEMPSTRRSARFRPVVVSSNTSVSSHDSPDNDSESEVEVRLISKKIKGVLPASWLRLDREAQEKRKAKPRANSSSALSPKKPELQRGVAQPTTRQHGARARVPESTHPEVIEVSDDSDDHGSVHPPSITGARASAREASELAAILDTRYGGDESDNMENDRLHLFTLGGDSKMKRKRQLRLTESFNKSKKPRLIDVGTRGPRVAGASRPGLSQARRTQRHVDSRRKRDTPPPLSIIDANQSPRGEKVPQFVKVAIRRARQLPDHGRQSHRGKQIRLHTLKDTEDASSTLQQWRKGAIKPRPSPTSREHQRQPLRDKVANQQLPRLSSTYGKDVDIERNSLHELTIQPVGVERRARRPSEGAASHKASSVRSEAGDSETSTSGRRKDQRRAPRHPAPAFRTAQLEGPEPKAPESAFDRRTGNLMFERGLRRAAQQPSLALPPREPLANPQLARFLADEDTISLPVNSVELNPHTEITSLGEVKTRRPRRLFRKPPPQRVDVDTRDYRQPSEPAVVGLIDNTSTVEITTQELVLEGLGPFGTVYPTTFDVAPLPLGTYFGSETFVGADELSHAIPSRQRDLDVFAGYHTLDYNSGCSRMGPWTEETSSRVTSLLEAAWLSSDSDHRVVEISTLLRSLLKYISTNLSFLDPIDRQGFSIRMKSILSSQFERTLEIHATEACQTYLPAGLEPQTVRTMAYLLVLSSQVYRIAQHSAVEESTRKELAELVTRVAKTIIQHLIRKGVPQLGLFLEKIRSYKERETGIQESDILVESVVICMHTLGHARIAGSGFWDIVSQELSLLVENTTQVKKFESIWATAFTLLPFVEFDASGILVVDRRYALTDDNWTFVKNLLKRLFVLYPATRKERGSSLNEYVRANLRRCHVLIQNWHWKRCEPVISTVFDFFGKYGLKQLQKEESNGSPRFLEQLGEKPQLNLEPSDRAFQIFLKCLAAGLQGLSSINLEQKKFRSIVFRCTPNHGRAYPKDRDLNQEDLDALRNHHDLLCTLYWASPPPCRPKLSLLRGLVQHENSHREACRLNVRAWANLTMFQLSVDEPYASLQPFAAWHKEMMEQTLRQYRVAKSEAEDYLKAMQQDGTSEISGLMVKQSMKKNQGQVIATLRDCVAGLHRAVKKSGAHTFMRDFLMDSGVVQLLELVQMDDPRLSGVTRETLAVFREYLSLQKAVASADFSQPKSEESQDYGEFPDLDELKDLEPLEPPQPSLDFIQIPLWHLLSNAFGAEQAPDDNLLMESVDTWVQTAHCQVFRGQRSWSYYLDSFSQMSWHQLRDTEQTRRFRPYFMAVLCTTDPSAYKEHRLEFLNALLVSLVERESLLRFQYRLLQAFVQSELPCPLLRNIPFYRNERTGDYGITAETLRDRRFSLLSSILANMQEDIQLARIKEANRIEEVRREYATLLQNMMTAMKNNYQQLNQRTSATGKYVEFVQNIVQFLNQYTSDICPVISFFTDSAAFPLPAGDPTYVTGRLCGYAPKLGNPGITKQLSTFIQTVAQQAAKDHKGEYLVSQLTTALANEDDDSAHISRLRGVLLQGIFPAYIEAALRGTEPMEFVIAKPIFQSLKPIFQAVYFDLRINDESSVENVCQNIWSIWGAFIRATGVLTTSPGRLGHPTIMNTISLLLDALTSTLPTLDYINRRSAAPTDIPPVVAYVVELTVFFAECLNDNMPITHPTRDMAWNSQPLPQHELLQFSTRMLQSSVRDNWSQTQNGQVYFGHGNARKEVLVDVGTVEEERWRLFRAIESFHAAIMEIFGNGRDDMRQRVVENIFV